MNRDLELATVSQVPASCRRGREPWVDGLEGVLKKSEDTRQMRDQKFMGTHQGLFLSETGLTHHQVESQCQWLNQGAGTAPRLLISKMHTS